MLGVALQLRVSGADPAAPPLLVTVHDARGMALAALRSPPAPLLLASNRPETEIRPAVDALVEQLSASGETIQAAVSAEPLAGHFAERWSAAIGWRAQVGMRQRLHSLTEVSSLTTPAGRLRLAEPDDLELVASWITAFDREALEEEEPERARAVARRRIAAQEVFLWEDSHPRSMAARARPTLRTVSVNAVYTPPELRGNGYASACVASLSRRLLEEGSSCCVLFTDLANPTSNAIYARIGYRPLLDFALFRFAPA